MYYIECIRQEHREDINDYVYRIQERYNELKFDSRISDLKKEMFYENRNEYLDYPCYSTFISFFKEQS